MGGRAEEWRIPFSVAAAAYQTIAYYTQPRHLCLLEGIQKRFSGPDVFLGLNVTLPSLTLGMLIGLPVPDGRTQPPPFRHFRM